MIFFYLRKRKIVTKQYLNQQIVTSLAQHIKNNQFMQMKITLDSNMSSDS
jgi:predicted XRE-type DNA-binding protein